MLNFPNAPTPGTVFTSGGPTWVWDGVKWKASLTQLPVNTITPVSGATVVLADYKPVFVNNASTLAALTFRLPSPVEPWLVEISFRSPVTVLSVRDAAGVVVSRAPTKAFGPGAGLMFRYVTGWEYWK